jgi:hypothetical protein
MYHGSVMELDRELLDVTTIPCGKLKNTHSQNCFSGHNDVESNGLEVVDRILVGIKRAKAYKDIIFEHLAFFSRFFHCNVLRS